MEGSTPTFRSASELPALVSYLRGRRCVLFVGAGISRPAGYPGWGELMRTVVDGTAEQLGEGAGRAELEALLAQGKFAEVADQCRTLLGRTYFGRLLRSVLARDVAPPEATHRAIVETPYACVVTTNFDTLLEDAFARWSDFGVPKAPTGMELAQHGTLLLDGAFFILKAHGTIHDDDSMVFTSEDYRRITHANPAFQAVMSSLLLTHAVLFVGYSLGDPNFRLLLDSQLSTFGTDAPPRYALMENVGATERAILRRTAGIEVISFAKGAYGEVAGLLQYLAQAAREEDDQPPAAALPPDIARPDTARPAAKRPTKPVRAPHQVLRSPDPVPALVLRLRARDVMVDSTWYLTTTRDLEGTSLPLERMRTTTSVTPSWGELQGLIPACIDTPFDDAGRDSARAVGDLLAAVVPGVSIDLEALPAGTTVMLDLDPGLSPLPWEWMTVGGQPLGMRWPTCRTVPGLPDASRGRPLVRSPLRALVLGDTLAESEWRHRLPDARREAVDLGATLGAASPGAEVTVLLGADASYGRLLHELRTGRYDVVHFSGISHYDESGSYLMLHDGKVGASELVTLLIKRPPALLVLNALYSGFVPAFCRAFPVPLREGTSFDDHYRTLRRHRIGFERAAARAGVGTFVGAMGTTGDLVAGRMGRSFYEQILTGRTAAESLWEARRQAQAEADARHAGHDTTALQLAMSGYADLRLVPPPSLPRSRSRRAPASSGGQGTASSRHVGKRTPARGTKTSRRRKKGR